MGIPIHQLKNLQGKNSRKGKNPFAKTPFGKYIRTYDPDGWLNSQQTYEYIKNRLAPWVEIALQERDDQRPKQ